LSELRKLAVHLHGESEPGQRADDPALRSQAEPKTQEIRLQSGMTVADLAEQYRTGERSSYQALQHATRISYDSNIRRILDACGGARLADLKAGDFKRLYDGWTGGGQIAMGHALIGMLRTLVNFGVTNLEDSECERLSGVLRAIRFEMAKPRAERLTADHVKAIISKAHQMGVHSVALAQAFQFDCKLLQRDVIGEWVPHSEPGDTNVVKGNEKCLRGIRWSDINRDWYLRRDDLNINLHETPNVSEELRRFPQIPTFGPVIVVERTGLPYRNYQFRRAWRDIATEAGIPAHLKNMDSRAID
jgi:hypothetical protein